MSKDAAENAYDSSKKKMRIYIQMFGYEKLAVPKVTMVTDPVTKMMIPHTEEYKEYEGKQLAVNYNDLFIPEHHLDNLLAELCKAVKADMRQKNLIL